MMKSRKTLLKKLQKLLNTSQTGLGADREKFNELIQPSGHFL